MIGRSRSLITWIALMVYVVLGLCTDPGMVLCFEQDGQVVLESAINGVCSDSWEAKKQLENVPAKSTLSNLACKQCTDIPVSMGHAEPQTHLLQTYASPVQDIALSGAPEFITSYLARIPETLFPQPPPFKPAIHRVLNTVILLI